MQSSFFTDKALYYVCFVKKPFIPKHVAFII